MAAGDHGDGLSHLVAEILLAAKQEEGAHRHREVIFAAIGLHRGVDCGHGVAGIGDMPGGGVERSLHILLRTDDHEVDHVPEIVELIVNPAGKAVDFLAQIAIERSVGGFKTVAGSVVLVAAEEPGVTALEPPDSFFPRPNCPCIKTWAAVPSWVLSCCPRLAC